MRYREEVYPTLNLFLPPTPQTMWSFFLPSLTTNYSKKKTNTCLNSCGNKSSAFWWEECIRVHIKKGKEASAGKNQANRAAAAHNFKATFTLSFICVPSFCSGKLRYGFERVSGSQAWDAHYTSFAIFVHVFLSGTYRTTCNRSITSSLQSWWKSKVNYFFQQYLAQEGANVHWQVPCTSYKLSEWRHFKHHLSVSPRANCFISSCLLPLVSSEYLDHKFFQSKTLILCTHQSLTRINLSTSQANWCSFILFTDSFKL